LVVVLFFFFFAFSVVLGIKPRTSSMLVICSITELCP
jgi:hypothetical protein